MLDEAEFDRWLSAAADEEAVARALVGADAFNAVVLHAEQCVQLLLKGLLRGVGAAKDAWGHGLADLGARASAATGLDLADGLVQELSLLERDYKPTRYPDALVSGTPRTNYGRADADRALSTAERVHDAVRRCWTQLQHAQVEPDGEQGDGG